jgi:hypothetical protein
MKSIDDEIEDEISKGCELKNIARKSTKKPDLYLEAAKHFKKAVSSQQKRLKMDLTHLKVELNPKFSPTITHTKQITAWGFITMKNMRPIQRKHIKKRV